MSAGIASRKGDDPSAADQLTFMADQALYQAKEHGRNRHYVHQPKPTPTPRSLTQ
jgi:PleD family two-component response regulator